ncbi:aldo/keto reductase [Spirulina major]|uniref:aldo/keto reductase n=1 Tax=Spirulina major TaxID=270636 RepID=UPI000AB0FE17|nr:aldo/keto reductase [Spirulina major]
MPKRRNILIAGAAFVGGLVGATQLPRLGKQEPDSSLALSPDVESSTSTAPSTLTLPADATIPERVLGKTGVSVPILGLGGAGPTTPINEAGRRGEAIALVEAALAAGVRYFDTAASYGASEENLGLVLPPYRDRLFLASKTAKLDRDGAWRELEQSLTRLKTDYLDLWQLHHISFTDEIDRFTGRNGAAQAFTEAKEQGIVRHLGITGHHEPDAIIAGLRRYPFDTTLIPVNAADPHHPRPFIPSVLPVAQELNVGVIAMKVPAYGRLLKPGVLASITQAFGFSLSQPGVHSSIIAADSPEQLRENVAAAAAFQPLTAEEQGAIAARVQNHWEDNSFYRAWT